MINYIDNIYNLAVVPWFSGRFEMSDISTISKAIDYIEKNLIHNFSINSIASMAGYEQSRFYELFKKETGLTPAQYIRHRRLARSCWDLSFSNYNIIDIAIKYLFSSHEAFTRAFKKRYSITPKDYRNNVNINYNQKKINYFSNKQYPHNKTLEGVDRVGFYKGGDICPEDVPFPSCMASVMRFLGEDYPWLEIKAHNKLWKLNFANIYFFGVSGLSFGLLWREGWHEDNVDHMFVADPREIIDRSFKLAGYSYSIVRKEDKKNDKELFKKAVMYSINRGIPVLAFGVIGPPECCIITGYQDQGKTVVGWNYFQDDLSYNDDVSIMGNGYFKKSNWFQETVYLIIINNKYSHFDKLIGIKSILKWAVHIMETKELYGRYSGFKALDVWQRHLIDELDYEDMDESEWKRYHKIHNAEVGQLAECRAWAGEFLCYLAERERNHINELRQAGNNFSVIHDICWEMWSICGGYNNPDAWKYFQFSEIRGKLVEKLNEIKKLQFNSLQLMKKTISKIK